MKEKVYCENCKHLYERRYNYMCLANVEKEDTPLRVNYRMKKISEVNANNDCAKFRLVPFTDLP